MADTPSTTPGGAVPAESATTRRSLLGIMAAVPALAFPAIAQAASADSSAWDRAMSAFKAVEAAYDADSALFEPAWAAWDDACNALPHSGFEPDPYGGILEPLTTANERHVRHVRLALHGNVRWDDIPMLNKHFDLMRRFQTAHDAREADKVRLRERMGINALMVRNSGLEDQYVEAERVLIRMPAPHLQAVLWKIGRFFEQPDEQGFYEAWHSSSIDPIFADVRRFAGGEA